MKLKLQDFFSAKNIVLALSTPILFSCIKEEALNAEADVLACRVDGTQLIREPAITNNEVKLFINGWEDISQVALSFTLTPGATIVPENGTVRDFTSPQYYTVTSEDGKWHKQYTVSFIGSQIVAKYHFEDVRYFEQNGREYYQIFVDRSVSGEDLVWGSGNEGFKITNASATPFDYSTSQADSGYVGKCLKLETKSTGFLGALFGAPLAAGNLFIGDFKINYAQMAKSTRLGIPFHKTPSRLTGYYKYKAGEKYIDKNSAVVAGKKDIFDIYAVMYEVTTDGFYLDGTNSKTDPSIVLMAQLQNPEEIDRWTQFSIDFSNVDGRSIDPQKLADGKYNFSIVMSSSAEGAHFNGAIGSTLYVDELQLYYE